MLWHVLGELLQDPAADRVGGSFINRIKQQETLPLLHDRVHKLNAAFLSGK
jgi:hypothetical protein